MLFDEGPAACPFVALESDRDRRSAEPDPRHRCYAEPTPAPRALAHQREFCLSPDFGGCPIFRDWAIRAAAMPVPLRPVPRAVQQQEEEAARAAAAAQALVAAQAEAEARARAEEEARAASEARAGVERIPSLPLDAELPAEEPEPPADESHAAGGPSAEESEPRAAGEPPAAAGLWADRPADDQPAADEPPAPPSERRRWTEDWPQSAKPAPVPPPVEAPITSPPTGPQAGSARAPRVDFAQRRESVPRPEPRSSRRDEWASQRADLIPAWERERYAAYPTIGTRLGLGDAGALLSRLTRMFGIIAVAFLIFALLLLAPGILGGFFAAGPSPTPSPSPTPVGSPTPAPTPTPTPEPTTGRYIIQAGDTICRIARIHGLTYAQVLGANPQITNPSLIQAGQVVIIPADTFVPPTPAPGATPLIDPCG
jgi:hypothetical protein